MKITLLGGGLFPRFGLITNNHRGGVQICQSWSIDNLPWSKEDIDERCAKNQFEY